MSTLRHVFRKQIITSCDNFEKTILSKTSALLFCKADVLYFLFNFQKFFRSIWKKRKIRQKTLFFSFTFLSLGNNSLSKACSIRYYEHGSFRNRSVSDPVFINDFLGIYSVTFRNIPNAFSFFRVIKNKSGFIPFIWFFAVD